MLTPSLVSHLSFEESNKQDGGGFLPGKSQRKCLKAQVDVSSSVWAVIIN